MELRQQIALSQLIEAWEPARGDGGVLVLPHEARPEWLESALPSLQRLRLFAWILPANEACAPTSAVQALLHQAWLVPQVLEESRSLGMQVWLRDAQLQFQATVLAERDGLRNEVKMLEEEKRSLIGERDVAAEDREKLREQVQSLENRMYAINRELDAILALIEPATFEGMNHGPTV